MTLQERWIKKMTELGIFDSIVETFDSVGEV